MSKSKNIAFLFVTFSDTAITWNLLNNEGVCILNTRIAYDAGNVEEVCRQTLTFITVVIKARGLEHVVLRIDGDTPYVNVLAEFIKKLKEM